MEKIIKLTIIIRIKEKDMDKTIFPEEENFVKKGAIVMPIFDAMNKPVARIPLPLSYKVLPVDISSGNMAEYPRPAAAIKTYIKIWLCMNTTIAMEIMARIDMTSIIFIALTLPAINKVIPLPITINNQNKVKA